MHKGMIGAAALLFGMAALVGASGYLVGNLPSAEAQDFGPVVTGGEMPFMSFSLDLNQALWGRTIGLQSAA